MGADVDISKYLHPIDLVSPVEAALHLRNARQNEETQRMFAQNTMARQSAEDKRRELEDKEKHDDKERQRRIGQAGALADVQRMMQQKGGEGPARALADAWDIPLVNPLTATTQAAQAAPAGDAVDQLLASPEGQAAAAPAVGPGPVEGPASSPPSVTSGGMAPVVAASREGAPGETLEGPQQMQDTGPGGRFLLPTAFHVSPGMQAAMDHKGYVPPGSAELPAGPSSAAPGPGDLESLMSRAAPQATPKPEAPPMPLLYEAVMGGHHYPISTEQPKSGLSPKFDAVFQADLALGAPAHAAFGKAYAAQQAEEHEASKQQAMLDLLGAKGDQRDAHDSQYRLTVDQQLQREKDREANARSVARIRAAAAGASTPQQQSALAQMIAMKEQGAQDSEIAAFGAEHHVDPKVWNAPVKNVQTEATGATRATERRAGMEVTDADGKVIGTAKTPQAAADLNKKTAAWSQLQTRYQALIDDVKQNGGRVNPLDIDASQRRDSLAASAAAAARVYNGLGATDASQKLEAEILGARGTLGHGIVKGANPGVLQHVFDEAAKQHQARLNTGMRAGGGVDLPAPLTHKKSGGGSSDGGHDLDALEAWSAGLGKK